MNQCFSSIGFTEIQEARPDPINSSFLESEGHRNLPLRLRTAPSNMIHHVQSFLNPRFSVLLALAESAQLGQGEFVNAARTRAWTAVTFGRITKGRRHPLHRPAPSNRQRPR